MGRPGHAVTMDPRWGAAGIRTSVGSRRIVVAENPGTGVSRGARIPGGIPGGEETTRAAGPLLPGLTTLVQAVTVGEMWIPFLTPET